MIEIFTGLATGFFNNLINDMQDLVAGSAETHLLSTHDLPTFSQWPLTDDPALQAMIH